MWLLGKRKQKEAELNTSTRATRELTPELIKKIKTVHIRSSRLVNTMMAGQYKSVFKGSGIEFESVREYSPGDDVKSIDWKVSARMGKPFIKLYQEEREVIVMLLIDMSASGNFGTTDRLKIETAAEIASILAFNAIKNNDKVGAIFFTDQVEKYIPPKKGSAHIWRVIKEIFTYEPVHRGTDIVSAVHYLGSVCSKRTVTFVISDFLTSNYIKPLRIASKKHEMICIVLQDKGEFVLPQSGIIMIEDMESGQMMAIDASDKRIRQVFELHQQEQFKKTLSLLTQNDIDCLQIATHDSVPDALTKYFRIREKRMRK
ncbi:MAG: DUF58 domain-containing protein [Desulfobacterales bacterium]|nr:DUF58 domain-containing protein [Desulfobacterales bacterium]